MARPNSSYPSERPGKPCGASWPDPLRITGRLSQTNSFGSDIYVDLDRIAEPNDLRRGQGLLTWGGPHETRVRDAFESRIRDTLDDLVRFREVLGDENQDAVEGLLRMAVENLDYVDALHKKWEDARWPLSRVHYNADHCKTELDMGKVFGGGFDRCPTYDTHLERDADRDEIVKRYVDSAHAIRCAEWGMWRVVLYRRAREAWKNTPRGSSPTDLAPTPPSSPKPPVFATGFVAKPGVLPPPTQPTPPGALPEFPPEIGGEALPPPPPPEPAPSLGEPAGLGDPELPPESFDPERERAEGEELPEERREESREEDREALDRFDSTAKFGVGAVVLGSIAATAITGAAVYGVAKLIRGRDDDGKKGRKRK